MAQKKISIPFLGLSTTLDATKIGLGAASSGSSNFSVDTGILELGPRDVQIGERPTVVNGVSWDPVRDIFLGGGYGKYTTNTTYQLSVTTGIPTSGYAVFKSPYSAETFQIQFNDSASNVAATLLGLSDFNQGEASVSGGPWPYQPINISLGGQYAGINPASPMTYVSTTFNNSAVGAIVSLIVGGTFENYLVVIHNLNANTSVNWLFSVADASGGAWTSTTWTLIASDLAPGKWNFVQYLDKIYGVNAIGGIGWYQLGGASWSSPAGIPNVLNPPGGPSAAPTNTYPQGFDGTGTTPTYSGWQTTNPTTFWVADPLSNFLVLTMTAAQSGNLASVTVPLTGNTDFSKQDYWEIHFTPITDADSIQAPTVTLTLLDGSSNPILPDQMDGGNTSIESGQWRGFYFGTDTQVQRQIVSAIVITFVINAIGNGDALQIFFDPLDVWLNDTASSTALSANGFPTKKTISYAYTYFQVSTGLETTMSEVITTPPVPIAVRAGNLVALVAPGSTLLTDSDLVKFYRFDQNQVWRQIAVVPNDHTGGRVTFSDFYMADQVQEFPQYGHLVLPGGFPPSVIATWKGCLVVGAGPLVFISAPGQPTSFAPSPEEFAALSTFSTSDPTILPRTLYMAQDRSDPVVGIVGQDGLYLAGNKKNYAMVNGNTPNDLTAPLPIKNARGAVSGYQIVNQLSGGSLVSSHLGLFYYSVADFFTGSSQTSEPVEEELTKDIRTSWITGGAGAICESYEEIWAAFGGPYLHRSKNGHWEQGTFNLDISQFIPVEGNPLIAFSGKGVMVQIVQASTNTGSYTYQTGIIEMERTKLDFFTIWYTGAPSVSIQYWDSNNLTWTQEWDLTTNLINWFPTNPKNLMQGYRFQITITGSNANVVTDLTMTVSDMADARGN